MYIYMAKSRRNRSSSIFKNIEKKSIKSISAVPVVGKGLTKIGNVAKGVAKKSVPIVERGVSSVYGTLATGFNMGEKGVKMVAKGITKNRRRRRGKKTRRH
jgi:hypothetical protein